jgi:predicted nucleic acid-binding protein
MVIVDTSVWIDFLNDVENRQTVWLEAALKLQKIGLTTLILCEVLQGARTELQFHDLIRDFFKLDVFDTGDAKLAVASAQNYRTLRQRGYTIRRTIDCIIATFCIEHGHQLLHNDRDFDVFEAHLDLRVVRP